MPARVAALVVAAGRGMRAGDGSPKQYRQIGGVPMIRTTLSRMIGHPGIDLVQPVIHAEDAALFQAAADGLATLPAVAGGATRQDSVLAGLEALAAHGPEIVLVHDAARPFASAALIARTIAKAVESGSAIPAVRIVDGVKAVDATGRIVANVDRDPLRTVQTPQGFRFAPLLEAHRKARADGRHDFVDDAGVFEWAGMPVHVVEGEPGNLKLTTAEDFSRVEAQARMQLTDIRTATGFDVHAFGDGDHVMLGGLRIAHTRAALGHSDADVVLHALTDAILGALADGDIGHHFPPTDQRWRGAASDQFLAFAVERVRARGGRISLLDVTVLCEAPRIGPHRDAMRENIARIAGIAVSRVAVKATTTERLGFTGRGEGIAALATATVRLSGDADE